MGPVLWIASGVAATGFAFYVGMHAVRRRMRKMRSDQARRPELWERFYSVDWGETATNNYGFAPAPGNHPQRFQHQMYRELLGKLEASGGVRPGMKMVEVSCGRGGGLDAFLDQASVSIEAIGLDVASSAVDYCRRTYKRTGLEFVVGSAMDLPFADNSVDVVLNVEASNDYVDRAKFFGEVTRVLKRGGVFLYTDNFRTHHVAEMRKQLSDAGLVAEFNDITPNVLEACRVDTKRRRQVLRKHAPLAGRLLLSRQLANYAGLEGSRKYRAFADGRRTYLMTAAVAE